MLSRAASPNALTGLRRVIDDVAKCTQLQRKERLEILKTMRITAVIADQIKAAGGLLAEAFLLRLISVTCALPVNRESAVPLPVMPRPHATSQRALHLDKTGTSIYVWFMKPHARVIARYSKIFGLPLKRTLADCLSPLVQLSQTTPDSDFPRTNLCAHLAVQTADVVISHGGLNTVLRAMTAGTPLLVRPIAFNQPGVAARVVHAKAGLKLSPRWATVASIAAALNRWIDEHSFAETAAHLARSPALAGGAYESSRTVLAAIAQHPVLKTVALESTHLHLHESPVYAT